MTTTPESGQATDYGTVTSCTDGTEIRPATQEEWLASVRAEAAGPMPNGYSIIPAWHDEDAGLMVYVVGGPLAEDAPEIPLAERAPELADVIRRCQRFVRELDERPNGLASPRAILARQVLDDLGVPWAV